MDISGEYSVYQHINKVNGKRYIGITKQSPASYRWGANGCNYKESPHFWRAICKYGWGNFEHIVIAENVSKDIASYMEKDWISSFKTQDREYGYNIFEGGETPCIPPETRQKMSKSMIGNKNACHPCKEETKIKIGQAQKGNKFSDEHRAKISESKKGKSHASPSEETRKKISDKHKKNPVICLDTGEVFPSIQQCARDMGLYATNICACCK